jgi:hypothetical protein
MTAKLIKGTEIRENILKEIADEVNRLHFLCDPED